MFINYAYASSHIPTAQGFLVRINDAILFPLLTLLTAVAVLIFLWGCFEYVRNSGSQDGRATGARHILWGLIGMLIMLAAYAILGIAAGTFNLRGELDRVSTQTITPGPGGSATLPVGAVSSSGGSSSGSSGGAATGGSASAGTYVINGTDYTYFYNEMISNGSDHATAENTVLNLEFIPSTAISAAYTNGFISDATRTRLLNDVSNSSN